MCDAHGRFRNACPTAILLAELRVHIWDSARIANLDAVFFPQKRERNAFLCKLFVDLRKIRLRVRTRQSVLSRVKKLLNHLVGNVFTQRPGDPGFLRLVEHIGDRVTRAV